MGSAPKGSPAPHGFLTKFCYIRAHSRRVSAAPAEPFKRLFNGRDLTGWDGLDGFWTVKDGAICGRRTKESLRPETFLIYKGAGFSDFELHYKYKFTTPEGNSGVQFRSTVLDAQPPRRRLPGRLRCHSP